MSKYPLERYRIVDFGTAWAGAMVAQVLADMGAQVIRIESHEKIDGLRLGWPGKGAPQDPELRTVYHGLNRNKLSITANLKQPETIALLRELVKQSDVVTDNFTPGVLERAGLDYESLRKVKPDIVCVSIPSTGMYGPFKDMVNYAPTLSAVAGVESLMGYPGGRPLSVGFAYCDANGGLHGAIAILLALLHRDRTGEGQFVDLSQWEATSNLLSEPIMDYVLNRREPGPQGNLSPTLVPHNNYPCKDEDSWVSIAIDSYEEWRALCRAMGNPIWADEARFSDKHMRMKNHKELDKLIAEWTAQYTPREATEILQEAGVAAAPLLNIDERYYDPHFKERQLYVETVHPRTGSEPVYGIPWKLSDTPGAVRRHAPLLGEHNEYVYNELLGRTAEETAKLEKLKAIY